MSVEQQILTVKSSVRQMVEDISSQTNSSTSITPSKQQIQNSIQNSQNQLNKLKLYYAQQKTNNKNIEKDHNIVQQQRKKQKFSKIELKKISSFQELNDFLEQTTTLVSKNSNLFWQYEILNENNINNFICLSQFEKSSTTKLSTTNINNNNNKNNILNIVLKIDENFELKQIGIYSFSEWNNFKKQLTILLSKASSSSSLSSSFSCSSTSCVSLKHFLIEKRSKMNCFNALKDQLKDNIILDKKKKENNLNFILNSILFLPNIFKTKCIHCNQHLQFDAMYDCLLPPCKLITHSSTQHLIHLNCV